MVPVAEAGLIDEHSRQIRARLAGEAVERPRREESDWV
jgi:hypothetical protein